MIIFVMGCASNAIPDDLKTYNITEIPMNAVERVNNAFLYVIKFSNLVYNVKGKIIVIPVFQGTLGNVEHEKFLQYCVGKKMLDPKAMESGFVIRTKKGELKKTLLDFINFYKGNILKGYEKPYEMYTAGDEPQYLEWYIVYRFKVEDVPCTLKISVSADKKDWGFSSKYKSPEEVHPDEINDPLIVYEIYVDYWE